jgi:glycerate kinase
MHILIAPNAFKNSLPANEVAAAVQEGLQQSSFHGSSFSFPICDGGDGTAALIIRHFKGQYLKSRAQDPLGRSMDAFIGLIENGSTAVIEMATASGLQLLRPTERDPLHTSSYGTGELIKLALNQNAGKIMLGVGGSCTVDGGCGILTALGIRLIDSSGKELPATPQGLIQLASIDFSGLDKKIQDVEITVLCDVDNKLLGQQGAAVVFGPQKGASPADVLVLEKALERLSEITLQQTGKNMAVIPHGGAAGGAAAAMATFLGAKLVSGTDYFLDITDFDKELEKADILLTGEGSIDEQTLLGKAPMGVAHRAKQKNIPVIGVAGKIPEKPNQELSRYFDVLLSIGNKPMNNDAALRNTRDNLVRTSRQIGNLLALGSSVKS